MAVRVEGTLPSAILRWLNAAPTATAIVASIAAAIRRRYQRISVEPMSEQWLLNHQRDTHEPD